MSTDRLAIGLTRVVVNGLRHRGARCRLKGDIKAAVRAYQAALAIGERSLPTDALLTAQVRNDLAVLLKYTGRFVEAGELYESALKVFAARFGREHPEVATILHNLGGLAHAAGRPADGEGPAREALRVRRQVLGPNHPATAADGAALAGILIAMDRDDEAAQLLEHAFEVFVHSGPMHLEVGITVGSLGAIDARRGDLDRAEARVRQALRIKEQQMGAHHLELVPTLGTLGVISRRQGNLAEARRLYQRGIALLDGRVAPDHPHLASLRSNLLKLDAEQARGI